MSGGIAWQQFISDHFPGYLLPESAAHALSEDEAARFLERVSGRPDQLALLRAASTLAPRMDLLRAFVFESLPDLVRRLPSRTESSLREWEGGFAGRLDVRATLAHHLAGRPTRFVTTARTRRFDLPENVLVRVVATRLLAVLEQLRRSGATGRSGWGKGAEEVESELRHMLLATILREVPEQVVTPFHEAAARNGRWECYASALQWFTWLRDGLDADDPQAIARVVAQGALAPLDEPTRFELAVVIRLVGALAHHLAAMHPGRWELRRTLVVPHRRELASFDRDDGAHIRLYYNQAHLPPGAADRAAKHYLGQSGRLRPDVTVTTELPGSALRATVIEVKHSADPRYLLSGLHEAHLYAAEYASHLTGWPKAILVASSPVPGSPRLEDDVVAVDWDRWVPTEILQGLASGS